MTISEFVIKQEVPIRLGSFFGILLVMALWELWTPRRGFNVSKVFRWINNLGIVFLNSFLLRIIFPSAAVGIATFSYQHGWGLFNYFHNSVLYHCHNINDHHGLCHLLAARNIPCHWNFRDIKHCAILAGMLAIPFIPIAFIRLSAILPQKSGLLIPASIYFAVITMKPPVVLPSIDKQ